MVLSPSEGCVWGMTHSHAQHLCAVAAGHKGGHFVQHMKGSPPFCDSTSTSCMLYSGPAREMENLQEDRCIPNLVQIFFKAWGLCITDVFFLILENPQFASRNLQQVHDYRQGLNFLFPKQTRECAHFDAQKGLRSEHFILLSKSIICSEPGGEKGKKSVNPT